jgi:hypothetical protein
MKVVFVISSFGHGRGGHFYSTQVIYEVLSKVCDTFLINIGLSPSPVLKSLDGFNFINSNGKEPPRILLESLLSEIQPDVIDAMDLAAYSLIVRLGMDRVYPIVLHKCGGPKYNFFVPGVKDLITFSRENKLELEGEKRKYQRIHFIPNRSIRPFKGKKIDVEADFVIGRISRFTKYYWSTLTQTLNLLEELVLCAVDAHLVVIGTIQDEDAYQDFIDLVASKSLEDKVTVLTESEYTIDASKFIWNFDCLIATGRGVMEACAYDKIVFVPAGKQFSLPVLLDETTFDLAFDYNFSERIPFKTTSQVMSKIIEIINDDSKYTSLEYFDNYFDVSKSVDNYMKIYDNAEIVSQVGITKLKAIIYYWKEWKRF